MFWVGVRYSFPQKKISPRSMPRVIFGVCFKQGLLIEHLPLVAGY